MSVPKFYVGQRVVAVKTHPQGSIIKDNTYVVTCIQKCPCSCCNYVLGVGIASKLGMTSCGIHNTFVYGDEWLFDENAFAPVHENFQAITFEKVIEKELSSVN